MSSQNTAAESNDIEKQNAKIPIKQLIVHILLNFENSIDATSISDSITNSLYGGNVKDDVEKNNILKKFIEEQKNNSLVDISKITGSAEKGGHKLKIYFPPILDENYNEDEVRDFLKTFSYGLIDEKHLDRSVGLVPIDSIQAIYIKDLKKRKNNYTKIFDNSEAVNDKETNTIKTGVFINFTKKNIFDACISKLTDIRSPNNAVVLDGYYFEDTDLLGDGSEIGKTIKIIESENKNYYSIKFIFKSDFFNYDYFDLCKRYRTKANLSVNATYIKDVIKNIEDSDIKNLIKQSDLSKVKYFEYKDLLFNGKGKKVLSPESKKNCATFSNCFKQKIQVQARDNFEEKAIGFSSLKESESVKGNEANPMIYGIPVKYYPAIAYIPNVSYKIRLLTTTKNRNNMYTTFHNNGNTLIYGYIHGFKFNGSEITPPNGFNDDNLNVAIDAIKTAVSSDSKIKNMIENSECVLPICLKIPEKLNCISVKKIVQEYGDVDDFSEFSGLNYTGLIYSLLYNKINGLYGKNTSGGNGLDIDIKIDNESFEYLNKWISSHSKEEFEGNLRLKRADAFCDGNRIDYSVYPYTIAFSMFDYDKTKDEIKNNIKKTLEENKIKIEDVTDTFLFNTIKDQKTIRGLSVKNISDTDYSGLDFDENGKLDKKEAEDFKKAVAQKNEEILDQICSIDKNSDNENKIKNYTQLGYFWSKFVYTSNDDIDVNSKKIPTSCEDLKFIKKKRLDKKSIESVFANEANVKAFYLGVVAYLQEADIVNIDKRDRSLFRLYGSNLLQQVLRKVENEEIKTGNEKKNSAINKFCDENYDVTYKDAMAFFDDAISAQKKYEEKYNARTKKDNNLDGKDNHLDEKDINDSSIKAGAGAATLLSSLIISKDHLFDIIDSFDEIVKEKFENGIGAEAVSIICNFLLKYAKILSGTALSFDSDEIDYLNLSDEEVSEKYGNNVKDVDLTLFEAIFDHFNTIITQCADFDDSDDNKKKIDRESTKKDFDSSTRELLDNFYIQLNAKRLAMLCIKLNSEMKTFILATKETKKANYDIMSLYYSEFEEKIKNIDTYTIGDNDFNNFCKKAGINLNPDMDTLSDEKIEDETTIQEFLNEDIFNLYENNFKSVRQSIETAISVLEKVYPTREENKATTKSNNKSVKVKTLLEALRKFKSK